MIPYDHIPAHLRCSDRHLIVPNYPGGCRWWNQQMRKSEYEYEVGVMAQPRQMTDGQVSVLELLKREGEMGWPEIRKVTGLSANDVKTAVSGLTLKSLIYQTDDFVPRVGVLDD